MNELVKIDIAEISGNEVNSVNARELHDYLESKQDFSTWIKSRIDKFGFIEGEDYITLHKKMERQILIDYIVTIDMGKELAMVENNDKGKQARRYFIEIEKKHTAKKYALPQTYKEALIELIEKMDEIENLNKTKAYISDKKTATAMNTASQAIKKVNQLEIELDKSKEWASIKKMEHHFKRTFRWQDLKKSSIEMGYEIKKIEDQNYPAGVNLYHMDVWLEAYGLWIDEQ